MANPKKRDRWKLEKGLSKNLARANKIFIEQHTSTHPQFISLLSSCHFLTPHFIIIYSEHEDVGKKKSTRFDQASQHLSPPSAHDAAADAAADDDARVGSGVAGGGRQPRSGAAHQIGVGAGARPASCARRLRL